MHLDVIFLQTRTVFVCLIDQLKSITTRYLTYITLRSVFRVREVDEGDVRGADEEGEQPDGEDHQQCVSGSQPGCQGVDDAHVPDRDIIVTLLPPVSNGTGIFY